MSERVRLSIPISGINTSTPSHTVPDGAMEDLMNLRYKNDSFVNVCEPNIIYPIDNDGGFTILHKMGSLLQDEYIAIRDLTLHLVRIEDGVVSSVTEISAIPTIEQLKLSDFGTLLYVNYRQDGDLFEKCFIYKDSLFSKFDINGISPPEIIIKRSYMNAPSSGDLPPWFEGEGLNVILKLNMRGSPVGANYVGQEHFTYNVALDALHGSGFVTGDFQIMVAYKLFDGTIIKPSKPLYVSSYDNMSQYVNGGVERQHYWENNNDTFEIYYIDRITGVKISINIRDVIPFNDIVKSVVVLSTRPELMYDYDNIHSKLIAKKGRVWYFDTDGFGGEGYRQELNVRRNEISDNSKTLMEVPYYEIADVEPNTTRIDLLYDEHFKNIEHKPVFTSSFSTHSMISGSKFEYNNRLHVFDVQTQLFDGYSFAVPLDTGKNELPKPEDIGRDWVFSSLTMNLNIDVEIIIDSDAYTVRRNVGDILLIENSTLNSGACIALYNLLCYPDARATKVRLWGRASDEMTVLDSTFELKSSYAHNAAYAFIEKKPDRDSIPIYSTIALTQGSLGSVQKPARSLLKQRNKIFVSAQNNPFSIDPSNIYTIGNRYDVINSINTATEQITETKFGTFPLYVFSERAIHALEVGSGEVLYSRVIGVSNERILSNTTTAGAVNMVFFISERGVMSLEGRRVDCISGPLEQYAGVPMPSFREYCNGARLSYNSTESELVVYNELRNYAYIYSLAGRLWSRRMWNVITIGSDAQIIVDGVGVCSSWLEDLSRPLLECSLLSRPLKFGSLEFKRCETLIARLSCDDITQYDIWLDGSNDLQSWSNLGRVLGLPQIRRTGSSMKYFRIKLRCTVHGYFTITNFDAEYYTRFIRKLR